MPPISSIVRSSLLLPFQPNVAVRRLAEVVNPYVYAALCITIFMSAQYLVVPSEVLGPIPSWAPFVVLPLVGPLGLLVVVVVALLLWPTCRVLGGRATFSAVVFAVVGGVVPGLVGNLLLGLVCRIFAVDAAAYHSPISVVGVAIGFWGFLVLVTALAEVSDFPLRRAAASAVLMNVWLVVVVALGALGYTLALR